MYIYSPTSTSSSETYPTEYAPTPKVPRGKRSDLTEKDLEEFRASFSELFHDENF